MSVARDATGPVAGSPAAPAVPWVLDRLGWMERERIWPRGPRYLWTDAFGVVLLTSLYHALDDPRYLDEAEWVVAEVDRVLGRPRGIRIGQAPDRDGQYFHYLAMWIFALTRLGAVRPGYRERAVRLVREIHPAFVRPGRGVLWKMKEDLTGPYPGVGYGAIDPFHGLVVYRLLDPLGLAGEIEELVTLVERSYRSLAIPQDLGLGMMLWLSHFFPDEPWAMTQRHVSLRILDRLWVDPPGYFCRAPGADATRFAFTNYGVAIGLQAVGASADRVRRIQQYFEHYRSGDHYDREAITHVMACSARWPGELLGGG